MVLLVKSLFDLLASLLKDNISTSVFSGRCYILHAYVGSRTPSRAACHTEPLFCIQDGGRGHLMIFAGENVIPSLSCKMKATEFF